MRRTRLLALFLDALLCAGAADVVGLALTALVWRLWPAARPAVPVLWGFLAAAATLAFLLRDAAGGRARRWLAFEIRTLDGRPPGAWRSIARNLVLLLPGWNLWDCWPALVDPKGEAPRRCDRALRLRILRIP
ncbi:MAG TPA: RDD family protein [Thermoanaerobaculia bacterium]|jgi:hypothetical protein